MMSFVGSQSFCIFLPSFMFVSTAVSEICELNQNKKKVTEKNSSEIGYFQYNTFPGNIFFNWRYIPFEHIPMHNKLKVIIKISLSSYTVMLATPGPSIYIYIVLPYCVIR